MSSDAQRTPGGDAAPASGITPPERFFGFRMGADRRIARWDKIVDYFRLLERQSDRMQLVELGRSTEGQPFLLAIISAPRNLERLEALRRISLRLSDPGEMGEAEARALAAEGRAVVCQTMSLHGNEIGGTQMAPELAFELLSGDAADVRRVLENVIFLLIPCFNPDGQVMVSDWYERWLGTEYEGSGLPWLYHEYSGHDNNRDAFMLNLPESAHVARVLFQEWVPQVYQDHHHMGSHGPRLYVAPYSEPLRPGADPLVWREIGWYGGHMQHLLEREGKRGVIGGSHFAAWGHLGFHRITIFHNIAGMLTESASAKLATPLYVEPSQLQGLDAKTHPEYRAQNNFPNPWPGGWWRLGDIVAQQKTAAWAVLDLAARYKDEVLYNAYLKARQQTAAGQAGRPWAYVVPAAQHDPLTARKLARLLLAQGVRVEQAAAPFTAGGRAFGAGSYVVCLAQPKMGVVKNLLERASYPDSYWTRDPDGTPMVYDVAADTVAEYMGVEAVPVDGEFRAELRPVSDAGGVSTAQVAPGTPAAIAAGSPGRGGGFFVLDGRLNDSYKAVAALLGGGGAVGLGAARCWRLESGVEAEERFLPAGAFLVETLTPEGERAAARLAAELGLERLAWGSREAPPAAHPLGLPRIGVYQRYWGGNMDEGWTRYVLDGFCLPYRTVRDAELLDEGRLDVLLLPSDRAQMIVGPTKTAKEVPADQRLQRLARGEMAPPEYRSGLGQEGLDAVRRFVEAGGRLVALDQASDFAIAALGLRLRNVVAGLGHEAFFCKGSTLRVLLDATHPLAYGMPPQALVFNWGSPAFEIGETFRAEDYEVVARYPESGVLESGWLIGEKLIAGRPCLIRARVGRGDAVLFGFRPQFRAQTHGTYKLLFNALLEACGAGRPA